MGMVALEQRIAGAYVIVFGIHGETTHQVQERGVSRQRVYREHASVVTALTGTAGQQQKQEWQRRIQELEVRNAALEKRLRRAVVLDQERWELVCPHVRSCWRCYWLSARRKCRLWAAGRKRQGKRQGTGYGISHRPRKGFMFSSPPKRGRAEAPSRSRH